jgi:hypothetical protein
MEIEPVKRMPVMSTLRPVILPLMWVEESAHLNTTYTGMFKVLYTYGFRFYLSSTYPTLALSLHSSAFKINSTIKYCSLLCGLIGLGAVIYGMNKKQEEEPRVSSTKVDAARKPSVVSVGGGDDEEEEEAGERGEQPKVAAIVRAIY